MDVAQVIEQYHAARNAFATGDPARVKSLYARSDDMLLANPFGGSSRGWEDVSRALDFASSKFRDGKPVRVDEISCHTGADLVMLFEHEHWETKGRRPHGAVPLRPARHDHIPARDRRLEACRPARGSAHDSACRWPASPLELTSASTQRPTSTHASELLPPARCSTGPVPSNDTEIWRTP
jgi:ketosteroid isomerase-like protein